MTILTRLAVPALLFACFAFGPNGVKKTVVIDPGHGGDDAGATHESLSEKELAHNVAMKIKTLNVFDDLEIVLLREEDRFMSLNERVEKINALNPDLVISLHINYSIDNQDHGLSAYISKNNAQYLASSENAKNIVNEITNKNLAKREIKDVNLFILNNVQCPAMLLELGYLTNDNDRKYISSPEGQDEIARRILGYLKK